MKPHPLFQVWTPDEVAECLEGVGNSPLYSKLWSLVRLYEKRAEGLEFECPPDPGFNCLADFWRHLTIAEKDQLNMLAEQQDQAHDL